MEQPRSSDEVISYFQIMRHLPAHCICTFNLSCLYSTLCDEPIRGNHRFYVVANTHTAESCLGWRHKFRGIVVVLTEHCLCVFVLWLRGGYPYLSGIEISIAAL